MKNGLKYLLSIGFLLLVSGISAQTDPIKGILGYWWMYDLGDKNPSGMIYMYEYQGKVYGRTVLAFNDVKKGIDGGIDIWTNPVAKSQFIEGNPFTVGMDVMWNLTWDAKKERFVKGFILDPRKKKPYEAEIWLKANPNELNMKGILPGTVLGGSVTWKRATEADLPNGLKPMAPGLTPKLYY